MCYIPHPCGVCVQILVSMGNIHKVLSDSCMSSGKRKNKKKKKSVYIECIRVSRDVRDEAVTFVVAVLWDTALSRSARLLPPLNVAQERRPHRGKDFRRMASSDFLSEATLNKRRKGKRIWNTRFLMVLAVNTVNTYYSAIAQVCMETTYDTPGRFVAGKW